MKLTFLGTGHWSSSTRRPLALLCQVQDRRILLECPAGLRLDQPPHCILVTCEEQFNRTTLEQLVSHGANFYPADRGFSLGDFSVRTYPQGLVICRQGVKLLAYAPEALDLPDELLDGALCAVLSVSCETRPGFLAQIARCGVRRVFLVSVGHEVSSVFYVPSDGEVIEVPELPLNPALFLPSSLAGLLRDGRLGLVARSRPFREFTRVPVYVCDPDGVVAKIVLSDPEEVSVQDFDRRFEEHRIDRAMRRRLWPGASSLYLFRFVVLERYDPPLLYKREPGFTSFSKHIEILEPAMQSALTAIQDLERYDPARYTRLQRLDDFRILAAHYASHVLGRRVPWPVDRIISVGLRLARYLADHDGVVFHPDQMRPSARRFFLELLKRDPTLPHTLLPEEIAVAAPALRGLSARELRTLHLNVHLTRQAGNRSEALFDLHLLVHQELRRRNTSAAPDLPPLTLSHHGVSLCGSLLYGREPDDIDILVRYPVDLAQLYPLSSLFDRPCHFFIEPRGPNWPYLPLGDLVICSRPPEAMVTDSPLECLKGLRPLLLWPSFLTRDRDRICVAGSFDSGLELKLTRLFPGTTVEFEATASEQLADLWFIPFSRLAFEDLPWDREFLGQLYPVPATPSDRSVPLLAYTPGRPFTPLKVASGYHVGEFYDIADLFRFWVTEERLDRGIVVQPKADGIRLVLHKDGQSVRIFTEDRQRDRAAVLTQLADSLRRLRPDRLILDAEVLEYEDGQPVPRHEMIELVVSRTPPTREVVAWVHDCIFLEEDISGRPYLERLKAVEQALQGASPDLRAMPFRVAHKPQPLRSAIIWASSFTQVASEGAMLKVADSPYAGERSPDWAKLKLAAELKVKVIGVQRKPNPWPEGRAPAELEGEAAIRAYRELSRDSRTYLVRAAIIGPGGRLVPIEADHVLTPGDLTLRWKDGEWRGTADPRLWEMAPDFPHRGPGELAYGVTYARSFDVPPKPGDIVTVRPMEMRFFEHDGRPHIAWMFPTLVEIDPERRFPDSWQDVQRIVERTHRRRLSPVSAGVRVDLTRDEMRALAKEQLGRDWYVVRQPEHMTFDFVLQYHVRGVLDPAALKEARRFHEDPPAYFRTYGLVYLNAAPEEVERELQKADDERGDVSATLRRFITESPPDQVQEERVFALGNVHADLRFVHPDGTYLIGWTNDIVKIALQRLDGSFWFPLRSRILQNREGDQWMAQQKLTQPLVWASLVSPREPYYWRPPGSVGATAHSGACFIFAASGRMVYGVQKSEHYHEYFLRFDEFGPVAHLDPGSLNGRWDFKLIESDRPYWQGSRPWRSQEPYITTHDFEEEAAKEKSAGRQWEWNQHTLSALKSLFPEPAS